MRISLATAIVLVSLISLILCSCPENDDKQQCNELDYMKYVQCIRRKLRLKRSEDCQNNCSDNDSCSNSCNDCDCDYCGAHDCENFCSQCCQSTTCSSSSCCHRTCHAQCRTSKCRHECKKDCNENISERQQELDVEPGNITTIITLHTAINNTNIIDVPISINNTNINNFTLDNSFMYPELKPLPDKIIVVNTTTGSSNNCCNIVSQPKCTQQPSWPFINCSHPVSQQCGPFCKSPIVHKQPISNCMLGQCMNQMIYIPQPRPRCIYHPAWPYTSCGMPQLPSCEGCYHHYNLPFQPPMSHCSAGCYDEGYGIGPYYRQGPFYRRTFSHIPSCYQMGNCYGGYEMGYPSGFFQPWGFDFPQYYQTPTMNYFPNFEGDGTNVLNPYLNNGFMVEAVEKLEPNLLSVNVPPPVTLEAQVNHSKPLKAGRKSNKAILTIDNN